MISAEFIIESAALSHEHDMNKNSYVTVNNIVIHQDSFFILKANLCYIFERTGLNANHIWRPS